MELAFLRMRQENNVYILSCGALEENENRVRGMGV